MVKTAVGFGVLLLLLITTSSVAKHFWRGTVLPMEKVSEKWGTQPFDIGQFKSGKEQDRAKMAYSLLKQQKKFVGEDSADIRKQFGDFDGFYFRDTFPTYMIQSRTKESESAWQIVFLLDNKFKVTEIIVHKNCCD
jgi:hypothetical protein